MDDPAVRSSATTHAAPLLLSGIPGAGKSTYARWLSSEHGYVVIEQDAGDFQRFGLLPLLPHPHVAPLDVSAFVGQLQKVGNPVVVEWGFPIDDPRLRAVAQREVDERE